MYMYIPMHFRLSAGVLASTCVVYALLHDVHVHVAHYRFQGMYKQLDPYSNSTPGNICIALTINKISGLSLKEMGIIAFPMHVRGVTPYCTVLE